MAPVKFQTFPCEPSGLPVRQQAGFDPLFKLDSLALLVYVGQHCRIRWITLIHLIGLCREIVHNANTEVSGSKNQFVPIVD